MTALKIPHEFFFYWMRRDHRTSHGPHWYELPWWRIVVKHYPLDIRCCDYEWRDVAATDRLWFYTRFGAFFIDWKWC